QTGREGIRSDRGSIVDRRGERAQILRRLEALLQRRGLAAELLHPLPVAPTGRDARLLQAAFGFRTFAGDTSVPRFGEQERQKLPSAQQIEIAEERVCVGGSREQSDDGRRLRAALVFIPLACHAPIYIWPRSAGKRAFPAPPRSVRDGDGRATGRRVAAR